MDRRGSCADLLKKGICWDADAISSKKLNIVCEIFKTCLPWFCATLYCFELSLKGHFNIFLWASVLSPRDWNVLIMFKLMCYMIVLKGRRRAMQMSADTPEDVCRFHTYIDQKRQYRSDWSVLYLPFCTTLLISVKSNENKFIKK